RQLVGVQPETHAVVLPAEGDDVANAIEPGQCVLQIDGRVVAEIELVKEGAARRLVDIRVQVHHQQDVGRALAYDYAGGLDHVGKLGLGDGNAVLHEHLGQVDVGAQLEGDVESVRAVVARLRGHVEHVL